MTTDSRETRLKELFNDAIELEPEERVAFLNCASDDESIRVELSTMIDAHSRAGEFLADPEIDAAEWPGEMIGKYRLLSLIGEGGFGRVYKAEQLGPVNRIVALKIIKLGMDTRQVITRFEAERQTLAMMDHPSIATVFDAGATETGRPYFVMELVHGVPVTEYCRTHGLSLVQRIELFQDICAAVQHAHAKGVIHRDIKPSNVLVTDERIGDDKLTTGNGHIATEAVSANASHSVGMLRPKIIDFGIAKSIRTHSIEQTRLTHDRQFIGTAEYMSPEQADMNAVDIDTRSDIYSLGVLLYELLTGVTPFDGTRLRSSTFDELQRIIREEEPPKPSTRVSELSASTNVAESGESSSAGGIGSGLAPRRLASHLRGDLDWITLKALEKDRDRRYQSASELSDDLHRHLRHEPVLASPPGAMYRVAKFVRRHRVGVIAGAMIVAVMFIGAVTTMIGMIQACNAAQNAREAAIRAASVNEFMREVLTSVEPDARGADVRLIDVLGDASRLASQRFAGQPDQEGAVRMMLGQVYTHLAQDQAAADEFQVAITLLQTAVGVDDPRTLHAEVLHARALLNMTTANRAAGRALEQLIPRIHRVLGPNHDLAIEAETLLCGVTIRDDRYQDALHNLRDLRVRARAADASDAVHLNILNTMYQALFVSLDTFGDDAARDEIELLAHEMTERAERAYGPQATPTMRAKLIAANMMWRGGKAKQAAEVSSEILNTTETRLGRCHWIRIKATDILADASLRLGDPIGACDHLLTKIECIRSKGNVIVLLGAISDALPILDVGGHWREGEMLAREFVAELNSFGGGHDNGLIMAELYVAKFVSLQGRLDEATALFDLLAQRVDENFSNWVKARFHLYLGGNLIRQGQFNDAEQHLRTAADLLPDIRDGTNRTNPNDVIDEFIALYEAWQRPDLVEELRLMRSSPESQTPIVAE